MTHSRRPMWRNGSSRSLILLIFPFPEVRGMLFPRLLSCRRLYHHHLGVHRKNEDSACSRERIEAPLPPLQPRSCDAILSGHEDLVSSGSDQFTMWGKMSHQEILAEHVVDIHKVVVPTSVMLLNAFSHPLFSHMVSTSSSLLNHLYRRGSAFTTGTLGPDEVRKMLSRNKLQESGISLSCKKLLSMSNTKSFMNDFT